MVFFCYQRLGKPVYTEKWGEKNKKQIFFLPSPTLKEIIKIIQNIIRKYPEANMTGIKSPD